MSILDALKSGIKKLNEQGVPIPLIRLDGKPSLTATLVFLSFNTALLGQLGKLSGFLGGVDLTNANFLFGTCLAAYLGRRFQGNGSTKSVELEGSESK